MFLTISMLSRVVVFCLALFYASVISEFISPSLIPSFPPIDAQALAVSAVVGVVCYFLFFKAKL
ncbi:hypothetical protein KUL10_23810 [Glaciecola sp. KUL10]|nr:hypothetical protein KUL10_23810 [Glaciecola sp. KUL10]